MPTPWVSITSVANIFRHSDGQLSRQINPHLVDFTQKLHKKKPFDLRIFLREIDHPLVFFFQGKPTKTHGSKFGGSPAALTIQPILLLFGMSTYQPLVSSQTMYCVTCSNIGQSVAMCKVRHFRHEIHHAAIRIIRVRTSKSRFLV